MLSDRAIQIMISKGKFSINPLYDDAIQPNSIDMRLSNEFRVYENHKYTSIDIENVPQDLTKLVTIENDSKFILHPGELVLASTEETVNLSSEVSAIFIGKSSLARVGLIVESAGLCDAGFQGQITLELANISNMPLILTTGAKIGQICLFKLESPSVQPYGSKNLKSKYQGQRGPTASRSFVNSSTDTEI